MNNKKYRLVFKYLRLTCIFFDYHVIVNFTFASKPFLRMGGKRDLLRIYFGGTVDHHLCCILGSRFISESLVNDIIF